MMNQERIEWILELARSVAGREALNRIEEIQFGEVGERGYDNETLTAFANWNSVRAWVKDKGYVGEEDKTMERLAAIFEKGGLQIEWSDEWSACGECYKYYRTSPDGYDWLPSLVWETDCDLVCPECLDHETYLESIEGDHNKAVTSDDIDPSEHGYHKIDTDFETGFHSHQDDSPEKVAKALEKQGIGRYLFQIDSTGQFDTSWAVWIHEEELEKFKGLGSEDTRFDLGQSPAEVMKRGLEQASHEHKPGCVTVNKITQTGCETKFVPHQDFIDGKALE